MLPDMQAQYDQQVWGCEQHLQLDDSACAFGHFSTANRVCHTWMMHAGLVRNLGELSSAEASALRAEVSRAGPPQKP